MGAKEMHLWQDVQAAVDFVKRAVPGAPLALVGYSFGCALLPRVRRAGDITALLCIAPTIARHNFASYLTMMSLRGLR